MEAAFVIVGGGIAGFPHKKSSGVKSQFADQLTSAFWAEHKFNFEKPIILEVEPNEKRKLTLEALHIKTNEDKNIKIDTA